VKNLSAKQVSILVKPLVFLLSLIPAMLLVWRAVNNDLGANPVETITHQTGLWGLYFLLITLSVTPMRRFTGIGWLLRLRRMLGLYAFFYASLHLMTYAWLDQYFNLAAIFEDIVKRPYITVGFVAWLLLVPLGLTSFQAAMRRLGRHWKTLHQLVYPIVLLVLLHFIWLVKAGVLEPMSYLVIYLLLLVSRLPSHR
jgi:sulfoxide reductase heme-binding subunit YedZ